jgi:hypothetical protein
MAPVIDSTILHQLSLTGACSCSEASSNLPSAGINGDAHLSTHPVACRVLGTHYPPKFQLHSNSLLLSIVLFVSLIDKWTCEDEPQAMNKEGSHRNSAAFQEFILFLRKSGNIDHGVMLVALRLLQMSRRHYHKGSGCQIFPLDTSNFCVLITTCIMIAFKCTEDRQYGISTWERLSRLDRRYLRAAEAQILRHIDWRVPSNLADLHPLTQEFEESQSL